MRSNKSIVVAATLISALVVLLLLSTSQGDTDRRPVSDEEILRRGLHASFPYDPTDNMPSYIWQTWISSDLDNDDLKLSFRSAEKSWTTMNPNHRHEVLRNTTASLFIDRLYAHHPKVLRAYNALPKLVLKADFLRYLILLARGGIYSDIDTTALKPAEDWISADMQQYGLVVGIEADPDRPDWRDWYARRLQFCQWTIMSKPGHPVLVDVVASITLETLRRETLDEMFEESDRAVMEFTGPGVWTDAIFRYFNNPEYFDESGIDGSYVTWHRFAHLREPKQVGDVVVLPITSFSPGIGHMGAGRLSHPLAFVQHRFSGKIELRALLDCANADIGTWKEESV